jgi:tetratricopeptide (TPR) repeat protein
MACMTKASPDEIGVRYNAGAVLERCGEPYQAEAVFRSVLDREPTFYRARLWAAVLRFQREGDVALDGSIDELSRAAWDSNDENADALVHLAHLELARGGSDDLDNAKTHLERAIVLGDSRDEIYVDLARTYMARQSLDLAARVMESALEIHPRSSVLHNMEGVIAAVRRDGQAARKAFDEASALDPQSFDVAMNRAAFDLDMRDFHRGERDYRVALDLRPDDYDARVGLALTLEGQGAVGKRDAAILQLTTLRELDPGRREAALLLRDFATPAP